MFGGGTASLTITGGTIVLDADSDGIDINGSVTMSAGMLIVSGPTEQMNGALDYGTFAISGGLVVATRSAGMAMAPSQGSSQASLLSTFATQPAGTLVHIESTDGTAIVTFQPSKPFASITVSSPDISADATYTVTVGGTSAGTSTDGLVDGEYTGGEVVDTTTSSQAAGSGRGPGGGPGRP